MNDEAVTEVPEEDSAVDTIVSYIQSIQAESEAREQANSDLTGYFDALGLTGEEVTASDGVLYQLREIRRDVAPHPLLATNFKDYSVVEGLLLLLVLWKFLELCLRMLKGGFSWLMW